MDPVEPPAPAVPSAPAAAELPADAGAVAGSAVISLAVALVAVAMAPFGLLAIVAAIAGIVLSLRARVQLRDSPYRGYRVSLVAFLLSVGVFVWVAVPALVPFVSMGMFFLLG